MKAAVLFGIDKVHVQDVPTPSIAEGKLLIKVKACGFCGSDFRTIMHGNKRVTYPAVIGHEIAAEVVAVGAGVPGFAAGERVALGADISCNNCSWCKAGQENICDTAMALGYQFAGGFAEYCLLEPQVVQHGPIIRIPKHVTDADAAVMEPLACCLNGLECAGMKAGKNVLIMGGGPIGSLLGLAAQGLGANIVMLSEQSAERLELSKKTGAAHHYLLNSDGDLRTRVLELTAGRGADVIIVACSSIEAQTSAMSMLAKKGVVNLFGGLAPTAPPLSVSSNLIHYNESSIVGSHGSTIRHCQWAMDLIQSGKVPVRKVVTDSFPLAEFQTALEKIKSLKTLKVLIIP